MHLGIVGALVGPLGVSAHWQLGTPDAVVSGLHSYHNTLLTVDLYFAGKILYL